MIPNPVEIATVHFPHHDINFRKLSGQKRVISRNKENREATIRILRQLIRSGQYYPDGYAIADAVLFAELPGAGANGAAISRC
jgi:hypothetical protein